MKAMLVFAMAGVLVAGCYRPDELERTANRLTGNMDKTSVSNLFRNFNVLSSSEGMSFEPYGPTKLFQTNKWCSSSIAFQLKQNPGGDPLWHELCDVWFDTNGVIVGYRYEVGD